MKITIVANHSGIGFLVCPASTPGVPYPHSVLVVPVEEPNRYPDLARKFGWSEDGFAQCNDSHEPKQDRAFGWLMGRLGDIIEDPGFFTDVSAAR